MCDYSLHHLATRPARIEDKLVTINPGSKTLDLLAGLGGGRFANPVAIDTNSGASVVRVGDFDRDVVAFDIANFVQPLTEPG